MNKTHLNSAVIPACALVQNTRCAAAWPVSKIIAGLAIAVWLVLAILAGQLMTGPAMAQAMNLQPPNYWGAAPPPSQAPAGAQVWANTQGGLVFAPATLDAELAGISPSGQAGGTQMAPARPASGVAPVAPVAPVAQAAPAFSRPAPVYAPASLAETAPYPDAQDRAQMPVAGVAGPVGPGGMGNFGPGFGPGFGQMPGQYGFAAPFAGQNGWAGPGLYGPGYGQTYGQGYNQGFAPGFTPGYGPSYGRGYGANYGPSYGGPNTLFTPNTGFPFFGGSPFGFW